VAATSGSRRVGSTGAPTGIQDLLRHRGGTDRYSLQASFPGHLSFARASCVSKVPPRRSARGMAAAPRANVASREGSTGASSTWSQLAPSTSTSQSRTGVAAPGPATGMTLAGGTLDRSRDARGMTVASRPSVRRFAMGVAGRFAPSSRRHPTRRQLRAGSSQAVAAYPPPPQSSEIQTAPA